MNETEIIEYITGAFENVEAISANGDTFFMNDPKKMFPFATLVTSDFNDTFSDLNRPGVFRLNIGPGKATFVSLFGPLPAKKAEDGPLPGYNYAALDTLLPHPVYGRMYWVSILNPSRETFENRVKPLLAEAYALSANRYANQTANAEGNSRRQQAKDDLADA
ncbi:MAG: hypothetical protein J0I20_28740 [Chloroflexi bacterium]|nr:hypothetical protein [Chloroflexota bacterium]OJV96298.1 MAG: hypothetical protein BGO39_00870 [Chloroflexi bacterium 54-19]